jgi:SAM-dependent methyltransferase
MNEGLLQYKLLGIKDVQECPLCGMTQEIIVKGLENTNELNMKIVNDKGYSFCNCKNIFFTNWKNISFSVYNDKYTEKYKTIITDTYKRQADFYFPMFKHNIKTFFEIGSIRDDLLIEAEKMGWIPSAIDYINRDSKYKIIQGNFEEVEIKDKFDCIWASHIFEHFKDPIKALEKCYNLLNLKGFLFIAMPDPYFIPWNNPLQWAHWVVKEHHILWDMDSFIDVCLEKGFNLEYNRRISGVYFNNLSGDFNIILRKNGDNNNDKI